jgi:hypothetical protein
MATPAAIGASIDNRTSDWNKTVMVDPSKEPALTADLARRIALVLIVSSIAGFILYTAWVAVSAAFANDDFPETLAVKVELMPLIFPVHMVAGGLALILLPLAISLRRRPRWHRLAGRIAATDVLVAGLTAFPVALIAPVTTWSAVGFSAQAATWLVLLALGIRAIRRRRIAEHWTWMILMTATTTGAIFFRIYLALWALWGPSRWFEVFYAVDSWIGWTLPLGVTAWALSRRQGPGRRLPWIRKSTTQLGQRSTIIGM